MSVMAIALRIPAPDILSVMAILQQLQLRYIRKTLCGTQTHRPNNDQREFSLTILHLGVLCQRICLFSPPGSEPQGKSWNFDQAH